MRSATQPPPPTATSLQYSGTAVRLQPSPPPPTQPRHQPQQPHYTNQPSPAPQKPQKPKTGPVKRATATFIYVMALLCIVAVVVTLYRNQDVSITNGGVTASGATQAATGSGDDVPASEIRAGQAQLNERLDSIESQIRVDTTTTTTTTSNQFAAPSFGGTWQSGVFTYEITQVGDVASIVESSNGLITAVGEGVVFDNTFDLVYEDAFGNVGFGSLSLSSQNSISGSFTSLFTVPVTMQRVS